MSTPPPRPSRRDLVSTGQAADAVGVSHRSLLYGVSKGWIARVSAAPEPPPVDDRPFEERVAAYQDEFVMRVDETLADLLPNAELHIATSLAEARAWPALLQPFFAGLRPV